MISAAFPLSPSPRPSTPPAASPITFLAAAQSSTPVRSGLTYTRKHGRVDRVLELDGERLVLARDHRRARQPFGDLLGHVRTREHRDRPVAHERGEPRAARRVEPLRQRERRAAGRQGGRDLREGAAGNGERRRGRHRRARRAPPTRRAGRPTVMRRGFRPLSAIAAACAGVAAGDRHLVPAVGQEPREHRSPRAAADDRRCACPRSVSRSRSRREPPRARTARAARFSTQ